MTTVRTEVCIAGGGPAGLMFGVLLARRGISVVVLEKHADFLRDFRGDTVHPSTLALFDELGLAGDLDALPHRDSRTLTVTFAEGSYRVADFGRLRVPHPVLRFMPQWHLLDLLARVGGRYPGFRLLRSHEVVDVLSDRGPDGKIDVRAYLTVGADGRTSIVRQRVDLPVRELGAPMDVLWFRLPRRDGDAEGLDMRVGTGQLALGIDRGDYWQFAYVIAKGADRRVRSAGLAAFRASVARAVPQLADRVGLITDWDQVKTLTVRLDRLTRWYAPGVLCIGDAAHAMSPIGGVGINLAIQDAVAAARILAGPVRGRTLSTRVLAKVQGRRRFPTVGTQMLQAGIQRSFLRDVVAADRPVGPPAVLRLLGRFPPLQAIPARVIGVGLRPERV
jgi:2-polyprenyl-6-methoxyphenol hydroxylase-like FAD-dependent oxidoreductase